MEDLRLDDYKSTPIYVSPPLDPHTPDGSETMSVEFDGYSLEYQPSTGAAWVNGCDCSAAIDDVETAQKMINMLESFIESRNRR